VEPAFDIDAREVQGTPITAPHVSAGRVPLFCDTALAGRIERMEAQLVVRSCEAARRRAGTTGFVIPIAGGMASFAEEGSPFNKVAGLGFGGVPDASCLDEIERAFAACGAPVQVELADGVLPQERAQPMLLPPFTLRIWPVTKPASSLAR
jgi:hypothetical protein